MGTLLQARGLDTGSCPELCNLERPEIIENIHRSYVEAGAMVVETNSFGGSFLKLKEYGLADKTFEINKKAAELAKKAVGDQALVAGSVGPTGLLLEPYGTATFDDLFNSFVLQIQGLVAGGADLIIIETMSDLEELKAAVMAAKSCSDLPIICSMTFTSQGRTMMGVSPEQFLYVLTPLGVDAVGANCSVGPAELLPVVERMAQLTDLPVIVQPNAGLPKMQGEKVIYKESPAMMAHYAGEFVAAGAQIIGGCCGTTPEHIKAVREAVQGLKPAVRQRTRPVVLAGKRKLLVFRDRRQEVLVGRSQLAAAGQAEHSLRDEHLEAFVRDAMAQIEAGAQVVSISERNTGSEEVMYRAVLQIQAAHDVPIAIDSGRPELVEAGLKAAKGRALLTCLQGKGVFGKQLLELAQKYGAVIGISGEVNQAYLQTLQDRGLDFIPIKLIG